MKPIPINLKWLSDPAIKTLAGLVSDRINPKTVPGKDWPGIIDFAAGHGLQPMLFRVCRHAGVAGGDAHWQVLRRAAIASGARHALLEAEQLRIDEALVRAGIPAIWLKGIVFARTLYPEPWLRPMSDLDVLIPETQCGAAIEALEDIGLRIVKKPGYLHGEDDPLKAKLSHHYLLEGGRKNSIQLELHYRLLSSLDKLLPVDKLCWFRSQTTTHPVEGRDIASLAPEAAFLYAVAHALLQHGLMELNLLWFLDLHLLTSKNDLNWQAVVEQAAALEWTFAVQYALSTGLARLESEGAWSTR